MSTPAQDAFKKLVEARHAILADSARDETLLAETEKRLDTLAPIALADAIREGYPSVAMAVLDVDGDNGPLVIEMRDGDGRPVQEDDEIEDRLGIRIWSSDVELDRLPSTVSQPTRETPFWVMDVSATAALPID
ncbi:hypothetical protein GS504_01335 [Rhodococcus hoagii]|nr:hypothetical protein [Prescottella equi]NKS71684.1 hypothetical protein [Prescottella equi]